MSKTPCFQFLFLLVCNSWKCFIRTFRVYVACTCYQIARLLHSFLFFSEFYHFGILHVLHCYFVQVAKEKSEKKHKICLFGGYGIKHHYFCMATKFNLKVLKFEELNSVINSAFLSTMEAKSIPTFINGPLLMVSKNLWLLI